MAKIASRKNQDEPHSEKSKHALKENFMQQPFGISIIIPVLNEEDALQRLLPFLLQNAPKAQSEIIIVDAHSTDNSIGVASKYPVQILQSPKQSRAAQMNLGAKTAAFTLLYFVHADTFPPASFFEDIRLAVQNGKEVGCFRYRFDSNSFLLNINAYFTRFHFPWCQGGDKTFYIPSEIFWEIGGYDEYFSIMEEYDFLERLLKKDKLHIIPKNAVVSARKYENRSWLQVQYANFMAFRMFRQGKSPNEIKEKYKSILGI